MIDDDDVGFVALALSDVRGWGVIIFIVIVGVVAWVAHENEQECAAKSCESGAHAELLDHKCVCVTEAK